MALASIYATGGGETAKAIFQVAQPCGEKLVVLGLMGKMCRHKIPFTPLHPDLNTNAVITLLHPRNSLLVAGVNAKGANTPCCNC